MDSSVRDATIEADAPGRADGLSSAAPYERDIYAWALQQGALLRAGRLQEIDARNIAEEIESLARSEFDKLASAYRVILTHMLKWDHQPGRRSRSWPTSIAVQRLNVEDILSDSPGMKSRVEEALLRAYRQARLHAAGQTRLRVGTFPAERPYAHGEIMERAFEID